MIYDKIFDFCKVRNKGNVFQNHDTNPTPRVNFIISLLKQESIDFELDTWSVSGTTCYNLILRGSSDKIVIAHHDVNNPNIDNANDNSASVINAIMIKKLLPHINVVLLDGEEFGGLGSQRLSDQINDGNFGKIDWVLNLELTGRGGKHFFIGNYPGKLHDHIKSIFNCPVVNTPYNDSVTLRRNGIDSVVINPLPPLKEGVSNVKWNDSTYLDFSLLRNCHSNRDSIDTISVEDMREFVEEVVIKILS
jgi:hypothetical protein